MPEPLEGIVVVEMTLAVQGPAAGLYLADMGAEVIKVEPPIGDPARYGRGRDNDQPPNAMGAQFIACNRGKRSVCLDLSDPDSLAALQLLLASADVFLTNYRAVALARLGLDYETLHGLYPQLVYAAVNGFGPAGPDADRAMLDGAAVARGGLVHHTGPADRTPCVPGAIVADTAGAMHLALGVMTALLARERHGPGQQVQTSALGTQLWLQQWELTHVAINNAKLHRDGSHHPNIRGPYGVYETSDGGHILLAHTMMDDAWDAVCAFGEEPELAIDSRTQTPSKRLGEGLTDADSAEIRTVLQRAFRRHTAAEWDTFLRTQPEVIWERVRSWPEVLDDEQNHINGYIVEIDSAEVGRHRTVGNLVTLSETPGSVKGGPPPLGEANAELLSRAGLSADDAGAITDRAEATRAAALATLLAAAEQN